MQWFRLYNDIVDNHKIRMLAFEDRWHFIAIMACHSAGLSSTDNEFFERSLAVKLGVQLRELDEIKRRLIEVNLIDVNWTPMGWDDRQFLSDDSQARVKKYREKQRLSKGVTDVKRDSNVTVTVQDTETDTETETESEQKQKRRKEIEAKKIILARVAALGIDMDLWDEFLRTRKRLKASNSALGLKTLLTEIEKLVKLGEDATELVERSNSNGWKSVFAVGGSQRNSKSAFALITDTNW